MITVLRGKNRLIGVYQDGKLVYTQTKVQKEPELSLERQIKSRGGDVDTVKEITGDYAKVDELPRELSPQRAKPGPKPKE